MVEDYAKRALSFKGMGIRRISLAVLCEGAATGDASGEPPPGCLP